jgi:hypothetical protein
MAGHVFLSYSRSDRQYVEQLASFLTARGIRVWLDQSLDPGDRFTAAIQAAIRDSSVMVAVMSAEAASSTWVNTEIEYAFALGRPIVPLVIEPCELPMLLVPLQYEDLSQRPPGAMPSAQFVSRLQRLLTEPSSGADQHTSAVRRARTFGVRNELGRISMWLGIGALPLSCCVIGAGLGIAAVVAGVVGVRRVNRREASNLGQSVVGITCGAAATIVGVYILTYYVVTGSVPIQPSPSP